MPGWERNSWGFHGDDGQVYHDSAYGTKYARGFTTGDVIGCGVSFEKKTAFFTKNGVHLGKVFMIIAFYLRIPIHVLFFEVFFKILLRFYCFHR
jgi:hypothetical protein